MCKNVHKTLRCSNLTDLQLALGFDCLQIKRWMEQSPVNKLLQVVHNFSGTYGLIVENHILINLISNLAVYVCIFLIYPSEHRILAVLMF